VQVAARWLPWMMRTATLGHEGCSYRHQPTASVLQASRLDLWLMGSLGWSGVGSAAASGLGSVHDTPPNAALVGGSLLSANVFTVECKRSSSRPCLGPCERRADDDAHVLT
jgi:hypothetical protein